MIYTFLETTGGDIWMKKNKKGLSNVGFGGIIILFMGIIVALAFIPSIAQSKGTMTDLRTVANASLGVMTNGTVLYITDYKSCSDVKIWNATGDVEIPSTNWTQTNNVVYNGQEAVSITPAVDVLAGHAFNKGTAKYQGTCEPLSYIHESGGRAIAGVIIIMFAIALAVVALVPALRSGILELMK